ncbi:CcdC protein domain-containing protein [Paenibacillus pasadenensis]|uniref:CcdC protein n=1 Tax=Paenibacillus pasadenensis TaxID=217090 RepID=A0A2N5ND62_9BACL|nr:CcdC protein domain-containing protein [Paenibacillus pasadenensis]PLT48262.1 hypothetical protein B8V81_0394 [Paenibacillus pasadenensis]
MQALGTYGFIALILLFVYWRRARSGSRPRRIRAGGWLMFLPLAFLALGFAASLGSLSAGGGNPPFPPLWEELCAAAIGVAIGWIMLAHTAYERGADGEIYSKPNPNFKYVILAVIVLRIALSSFLQGIEPDRFLLLTMTLAFCYIAVWRIGSFIKYRSVRSVQGA